VEHSTDKQGNTISRVNGVLSVSRSFGDFELHPYVTCEPRIYGPISISSSEQDPADNFLILACDGLWDKVSDEQAVSLVKPSMDEEQAAVVLRDFAFAEGSTDNISVVVVRFSNERKDTSIEQLKETAEENPSPALETRKSEKESKKEKKQSRHRRKEKEKEDLSLSEEPTTENRKEDKEETT